LELSADRGDGAEVASDASDDDEPTDIGLPHLSVPLTIIRFRAPKTEIAFEIKDEVSVAPKVMTSSLGKRFEAKGTT
jgi:hypothetical protein